NSEPTNLALKARDPLPDGWRAMAHHHFPAALYPYVAAAADETSPQGGRTVRITRQPSLLAWGDGAMGQSFPAAPWHGQRLTFSAALRAEAPRIGTGAQVIVMVWPKEKDARPIMAVQAEGLVRSSGWVRRSVTIDVPAEAERVEINLVVTGNAAGWFGDLELTPAGVAGVADGRHDFPKMPVGVHHRERVGDFIEWERLLPDRLWAEECPSEGMPHIVSTIFPKCWLARIIDSASTTLSRGKVLSIGSESLPASTAGHRSARISRTISRTSSMLRVRKVTPI